MAAPNLKSVDQLGMDEQTIDDPEVLAALEERQKRKNSRDALEARFKEAHRKALSLIERLELPEEGGAVRVGPYRITKTAYPARSVSFDTSPSTRIRIGLVDDDRVPSAPPRQEPISDFRRDPE